MQDSLKRIDCMQDVLGKYVEAMTLQYSYLREEISKAIQNKENEITNPTSRNSERNLRKNVQPSASLNTFSHPSTEDRRRRNTKRLRNIMNQTNNSNNKSRQGNTMSAKMKNFASEPIFNQTIHKIPGIGPSGVMKLKEKNYDCARKILAKYLENDKDEFLKFFQKEVGILPRNAIIMWDSLNNYCDNFM